MKKHIALALTGLLLAATPSSAAEQRQFIAAADATALKLTITEPGGEPQGLTIGASSALVQSSSSERCAGTACASSAAAVEPFGETAEVVAKTQAKKDSAEGFAVPEGLEPILAGALGTATVTATPAPSPTASGSATAGQLEVNVLNSLLTPIKNELDGAVDQVVDGLDPLLGPVKGGDPTGLTTEVDELLDALVVALADNPLAIVEVGASSAEAADNAKKGLTSASATAAGADIKLAPVDVLAPDGLFRIKVGDATASVQSNGKTATKSSKGSVVKLFVANLATPEDGDYQEVDVATDQPEQCFGESPLLVCIIAGGTAEAGEGPSAGATGAAIRIKAFADADEPGAGNPLPGITLAVAEATAAVNAAVAGTEEVVDRDVDRVPDQPELPSTGTGIGAIGLAVLAVGIYGVTRLRRR